MKLLSSEAQTYWLKSFVLPFNRRMGRVGYFLAIGLISMPGKIMNSFDTPDYITIPAGCFVLYTWLCITLARMHDIGLRGLWLIPMAVITLAAIYCSLLRPLPHFSYLLLLPILAGIFILLFYPPQRRDNRFGPYDPKRL